jgi:hypothetical protein
VSPRREVEKNSDVSTNIMEKWVEILIQLPEARLNLSIDTGYPD